MGARVPVGTACRWVKAEKKARDEGLPSPFLLKEEEPPNEKLKVKGAKKGEATSIADKALAIEASINSGGRTAKSQGRSSILPPQLLIGICCMLFTLSQTGVPMNCAVALPLIHTWAERQRDRTRGAWHVHVHDTGYQIDACKPGRG